MGKFVAWRAIGINEKREEEDITTRLSEFLQNQIEEEVQHIEDDGNGAGGDTGESGSTD
jgi:hypothetical protein